MRCCRRVAPGEDVATPKQPQRPAANPRAAQPQVTVNPAAYRDPVALLTQWHPIVQAASRPRRLVEVEAGRLELRAPTLRDLLVIAAFAAAPFAWMGYSGASAGQMLPDAAVVAVLALAAAAVVLWRGRPAVFDRGEGAFWIGWRMPDDPRTDRSCRLMEIHALQLVRREWTQKREYGPQTVRTYQLNLVLRDGRRITLATVKNLKRLREDARQLRLFLGCKVWDAVPEGQTLRTGVR